MSEQKTSGSPCSSSNLRIICVVGCLFFPAATALVVSQHFGFEPSHANALAVKTSAVFLVLSFTAWTAIALRSVLCSVRKESSRSQMSIEQMEKRITKMECELSAMNEKILAAMAQEKLCTQESGIDEAQWCSLMGSLSPTGEMAQLYSEFSKKIELNLRQLKDMDWVSSEADARKLAHRMRGMVSSFGFTRLTKILENIELAPQGTGCADYAKWTENASAAWTRAASQISAWQQKDAT